MQAASLLSPSPERRAGNLALVEQFDGMAGLRNGLRRIANDREDWAGIPLPLAGERLVVEPTYPKAKELMAIGCKEVDQGEYANAKIRNEFYSWRRRCTVIIWERDGVIEWGIRSGIHHFTLDLGTLGCSDAWGVEQESNAVETLAGMLRHRQFKQYMLTGMFIESSPRSHVKYCFRRLRPTIAMHDVGGQMKIMCAMCMHPIGYYAGTWAGAMCPTDDVIAHLSLMRGDEPMFWRRCNQHPSWVPEAGL